MHELGVRLVSFDRPGLGVSTPAPGRRLSDFLASRIPGAVLRTLAGEAGSVLWTRGEELLRRIVT
ncbi:hypothetical protein [Saccharomonospora sp. NB11]|uniref:hypothetical protein n=1 Tax=Saccharomonospora sp. NB11 TaxID=1642298 RepID=UPI001E63E28A|nr:hypothetical protein [Saccharomonospora sp. NB11]